METSASAVGFEAVHREFRPKVLRYLARLAGPQDAPDLAQITMLTVSEHLPRFRGESSLATWIYRIATNVAIDEARRGAAGDPRNRWSACSATSTIVICRQLSRPTLRRPARPARR